MWHSMQNLLRSSQVIVREKMYVLFFFLFSLFLLKLSAKGQYQCIWKCQVFNFDLCIFNIPTDHFQIKAT